MNQEDILKMAREAGIAFKPMVVDGVEYEYRYAECNDDIGGDEAGCIERFAALVAAKAEKDEREEFAELCDAYGANFKELSAKNDGRASDMAFGQAAAAESLAHAIRAKG